MELFGENLVLKVWIFIKMKVYAVSRFDIFKFFNF